MLALFMCAEIPFESRYHLRSEDDNRGGRSLHRGVHRGEPGNHSVVQGDCLRRRNVHVCLCGYRFLHGSVAYAPSEARMKARPFFLEKQSMDELHASQLLPPGAAVVHGAGSMKSVLERTIGARGNAYTLTQPRCGRRNVAAVVVVEYAGEGHSVASHVYRHGPTTHRCRFLRSPLLLERSLRFRNAPP